MSLGFAGFPVATFKTAGDPLMLALATVRAECDRKGRCFKSQRYLARKAGMPLSTFNWAVRKAADLGIWSVIPPCSRRKPATICFADEHLVVTAQKARECPIPLDTKSKAIGKKNSPPGAPREAGGGAPDNLDQQVKGRDAGIEGGAIEAASSPTPEGDQRPGSTRRSLYGLPRAPRRPRGPRQRQRGAETMAAFMAAADEQAGAAGAPTTAGPALPPPPEIIPPNEVIPFPRRPLQRRRGFSPATDLMEAFYYAAEEFTAPDRGDPGDPAEPVLASGRNPGGPQSRCQSMA